MRLVTNNQNGLNVVIYEKNEKVIMSVYTILTV